MDRSSELLGRKLKAGLLWLWNREFPSKTVAFIWGVVIGGWSVLGILMLRKVI